jgi:predicted patatin/cPLA2 family phospholipase
VNVHGPQRGVPAAPTAAPTGAPTGELAALELLAQRQASGSSPSERADGYRLALVIEGGGNRAAYSAGMAIALARAGLIRCFDDVYGTSGGALNGAWILTESGADALSLWASPAYAAERVADIRHLLRGRALVDLDHLLNHVYRHVFPMEFEAILASNVKLHPVATDAATGEATDLFDVICDVSSLKTALKASASLPLLAGRPVALAGRRFIDGGLSEPVPVHRALAEAATHVLVLRTRREDQAVKPPSGKERAVMLPWLTAFAPGARTKYQGRHLLHRSDEVAFASDGRIVQIRPPSGSVDVARLTADSALIAEALDIGERLASDALASAGVVLSGHSH